LKAKLETNVLNFNSNLVNWSNTTFN